MMAAGSSDFGSRNTLIGSIAPLSTREIDQNLGRQLSKNIFGFFPNPKEFLEKIRDKVSDNISEKTKEYVEPSPYNSVLDIPCRLLDDPKTAEAMRIGEQAHGKKAILIVNVASK